MLTDKQAAARVADNIRFQLAKLARDSKIRINQSWLGREANESPMMISRLIRGEQMTGYGTLSRVAAALMVSVDWLLADHSAEIAEFTDRRAKILA